MFSKSPKGRIFLFLLCFYAIESAVAVASDFVATLVQKNPASNRTLDVSEEQIFLNQAKMDYMQGKYQAALSSLEGFIMSHSKSVLLPDVYLLLSEIYSERSELENVVKYLTSFLDRFPNEPRIQDVQMRLSGLYFQQGALKKVFSLWESIPGEVDSKRIVYDRLAKIYADRGDYLSSLKIMLRKRELTDDPIMYTIFENEISLLIREKLQVTALESIVEEYGVLFPADEALIRLMSFYDEQGDYYREERDARRFLKRFPEHHHSQRVQNFLNRIGDKIKAERYLIALILPLSGKLRDFGNRALQGAELAIQFFKEAFPEISVGLIVRDLREDPSQIRITLEGWLNTYLPIAIVGPLLSKEVNRIAPVVERANIALITPGATARHLVSLGNAVFRNAATNRFLCSAIAEYAVLRLNIARFAVLYPEEGSGRRWIDCFSEGVQKLGGKVVLVESYSLSETDFTKTIRELKKKDLAHEGIIEILEKEDLNGSEERDKEGETEEIYTPGFEGIFLPADAVRAGLIIPQLIFHDYDGITLLGTNSWNSSEFLDLVGPYAEGAVFADGFFKDSLDPNVEVFVRAYQERYSEDPDLFAAQAFDATRLILNTLTEGALTPQKVKIKVANTIDFPGISGFVYEFFEGEAIKEPFFIQVENGRFVQAH